MCNNNNNNNKKKGGRKRYCEVSLSRDTCNSVVVGLGGVGEGVVSHDYLLSVADIAASLSRGVRT